MDAALNAVRRSTNRWCTPRPVEPVRLSTVYLILCGILLLLRFVHFTGRPGTSNGVAPNVLRWEALELWLRAAHLAFFMVGAALFVAKRAGTRSTIFIWV
jgi:hypothetical protein